MFLNVALALVLLLSAAAPSAHAASLSLFHNNDGESKLEGEEKFGGAAYFVSTLNALRAANRGRDQITISSGDNFLAGAALNASLASGPSGSRTYFDGLALIAIGYDAITIGNHDFDFGPDILAEFIDYYRDHGGAATFLSANLDFSGNPNLQGLVESGVIAKSTIVMRGVERYGIIGATTDQLNVVSNAGLVTVDDVLGAVMREVNRLQASGVNKIILSSHLQSITNEIELVGLLRGVDIVVAGGGDELLINTGNARNTVTQADAPYPLLIKDADGKNVAIVTTAGEYRYVGRLDVEFDEDGEVISTIGEPVVVDKQRVSADPKLQKIAIGPLIAASAAANSNRIARTEVFLEHSAGNTHGNRVVRLRETNLGNLVADAFAWAVANEADGLKPGNHLIGLQNGGGIREDLDNNEDGFITQGEVQTTLPFINTMAVIQNVDSLGVVAALENGVSNLPRPSGRFPHISGVEFDFDPAQQVGQRVTELRLPDGTIVWTRSRGVQKQQQFDIATSSFLAGPGTPDGYDFNAYSKKILTTGYADSLIGYLGQALHGDVPSARYGLAGDGRANALSSPREEK